MIRLGPFCKLLLLTIILQTAPLNGQEGSSSIWDQWRGPSRDGLIRGSNWPTSLSENSLTLLWRVEFAPSYSGPIVSESTVFVTGTAEKKTEVVCALTANRARRFGVCSGLAR